MSIVRAIYDEVESPVTEMLRKADRKRAERVIDAYYKKKAKEGAKVEVNLQLIWNLKKEIRELKKEKAQLLQQLS